MRVVVQRVLEASVTVDNKIVGEIGKGLLVLVGFGKNENDSKLNWMFNKILQLRIFSDEEDKMNLSLKDVGGGLLIVSQFTLYGDAVKGNRPSFSEAASPENALILYNTFLEMAARNYNGNVQAGIFGSDMKVKLINDGPVTITINNDER